MKRFWARLSLVSGVAILALLLVATGAFPAPVLAAGETLTGSTTASGFSGSQMPINDVQVVGSGNPTVPVKLRVTSGTLSMTTTTGLTFTGSSTGSTLQFSGSLSDVNTALSTLRYLRNSTGTDTLEVSLVNAGEVFFPDNGHLYEYVSYTATWNNANTNAQTRTKYGATGYLTTVTSASENSFVAERLLNAGWMGASDSSVEGDWKWVTGPESGTSFWSGASGGSTVSGRYANWGTGEPNNSGDEDCAQFLTGGTGKWNDLPCASTTLPGYVVEYGSPSSPISIATHNVSITTQAANNYPNTPTSLGPAGVTSGNWSNTSIPTFTFSLSDNDSSDQLRYRIQIDDTANFSSPVVDYTSAAAAQGSRSFTIGQSAGSGSYSVGNSSQALANGPYYWRVRNIDPQNAESSNATANSGSIAFRVDTTNPSTPSDVTTSSSASNNKPTWTWTAAGDVDSGLTIPAYTLEWSQSATFSSGVSSATVNGTSYTHTVDLADGRWYVRVLATDLAANQSSYAEASTVIDTTNPSAPGVPLPTTPVSDNTPTWQWAASTDTGIGLANPAYTVEWSQNIDFSGTVFTTTASANSFTHSTPLTDGPWYFRVKTHDATGNISNFSSVSTISINTVVPTIQTPSVTGRTIRLTAAGPTTAVEQLTVPVNPSPSPIILNNFQEYTSSDTTGKELSLVVGQVIYFTLDGEEHTITIKEIGLDYVIVTVASTPRDIRIAKAEIVKYDVNNDGIEDISIGVKSLQTTAADIAFKELKSPQAATIPVENSNSHNWWWLVLLVIGTSIIWLVSRRSRRTITAKASK